MFLTEGGARDKLCSRPDKLYDPFYDPNRTSDHRPYRPLPPSRGWMVENTDCATPNTTAPTIAL
jgi:hypothetical protein